MPLLDRVRSAAGVLLHGKLPNPFAAEPTDRSRAALVRELNDWCVETRQFWKPIFKRIEQEQKFAAGKQWAGTRKSTEEIEDYIGDMVQQLVNRKTASLYAKNPIPAGVLRDRMPFTVWDGNQQTIDACHALIANIAPQAMAAREAELSGQPVPPPPDQMPGDIARARAILADYNQGMQETALLKKVAETGGKLIRQQWDAQSPDTLVCGKQAVTRIITSRVAYVKVMYKRELATVPTETANTMGFDERLAQLQARLREIENDLVSPDDSRVAVAKLLKTSIEQEIAGLRTAPQPSAFPGTPPEPASEEGIVLDWLSATSVLVDRNCKCLKEFIGAHRIAHEILMTVAECETKYGVSLRDSGARLYRESGDGWSAEDRTDYENDDGSPNGNKFSQQKVCVWQIEDKDTGLCYVICDGVKDFLREPAANSPSVNRFWSIVPITFNAQEVEQNDPEEDTTIYPRSDVRLMMPMQINVNQAGEEKRKHRAANRPYWVGVKSKFVSSAGVSDLEKLARPRQAHDVLMMENLQPGERIEDYLQAGPKQPFDENLYDTGADTQAMMLATGLQASDMGEQRPDEKATGQNIAAQARATSESSNIDDLNFAFSTMAQMCWEMLIQEMPASTVRQLIGRGAVWPELNREEIADAIYFKIEAGSMGQPNQAAELQKIQVLAPQIQQMLQAMGKSPEPLLKLVIKTWDANIDLDELLQNPQVSK